MIVSPYLLAVVVGWISAQGLKYILMSFRTKTPRNFRQLYLSGNMPSAHSTTVTALAMVIGLESGFGSNIFALAALFAAIVMYDAVMVRRSSGEQGTAIQALITEARSKVAIPRAAKGHTPEEVLAGFLLGMLIGTVVFVATI